MPPLSKSNTNMPEKRPLKPILSSKPLTPRVAGSTLQSTTTPLPRRTPRSEVGGRDDLPPPASSFLGNNITPRSGKRTLRGDSANSTPNGTPTGTPISLATSEGLRIAQESRSYGSGANGLDKDIPKRPTVSFSPAMSDVGYSRTPDNQDSKFFFASDAKPTPTLRTPVPKPASNFLYASGESIAPPLQSSSASVSGSQVGEDRGTPKFFHANGTPDLHLAASPHFPPPRPSSVLSSSSRTSPRGGTLSPAVTFSQPLRPTSPAKLNNQYGSLASSVRNPAPISNGAPRVLSNGRGNAANGTVHGRKGSIESRNVDNRNVENRKASIENKTIRHARSSSGSSNSGQGRNASAGSSIDTVLSTTPLSVVTSALPVSTPEETSPETKELQPQSPLRAGHSLEKMNELAAEARRERKVMDLEITNSSLEAINRTLEREMRKVTMELRRYRRLSRSGRLSIAPGSMRAVSDTLSIDDPNTNANSEMSSSEDGEDDKEDDAESEMSEEESPDEGSLSPSAMAESDLKHRKRDEKRLQLDLTKHQQLLVDSQKMNQSLKRCIGWSEAMINEGQKALEYRVRLADVELGGRVLARDEMEEHRGERDNEGMSDIGAQMLREAREKAAGAASANSSWGNPGGDDRDSGIELKDGGQHFEQFDDEGE